MTPFFAACVTGLIEQARTFSFTFSFFGSLKGRSRVSLGVSLIDIYLMFVPP